MSGIDAILTGTFVGLITVFELGQTFFTPSNFKKRYRLLLWYAIFVLANGFLAGALCTTVSSAAMLEPVPTWLRSVCVASAYLALVRAKIVTVRTSERDIPVGLEFFFNEAKRFIYERVYRITAEALTAEARELAAAFSISELYERAQGHIIEHPLRSEKEKANDRSYIVRIARDKRSDERERKMALCYFILKGAKGPRDLPR